MDFQIKTIKRAGVSAIAWGLTSGLALAQSPGDTIVHPHVRIAILAGVFIGLVVIGEIFAGLCLWKVFVKTGYPGWASLIPVYNACILCKIVGKPGWWVILLCIPFVNLIIWIIISLDLAKSFGKEASFAVGLMLLGFVFLPILGFGDAVYKGPAGA